ncbi:DUF3040 domain-containing protein [Streptomyces sp. SKN60]|uniref:DUF3040 domain-containing protein n=1 Tax=Streptomyces sp. SKN60 TaxID=2855506 RepID=UPI0022480867|nr:DUF3040 domain-containing protein [Streptomyces sp. SKN60]MCX2181364.1 DUF3040 domain-containing protein [Streptomyces sp. SKN60]
MGGAQLSPRERRILAEIEEDLAADSGFARALGAGRTRLRARLGSGRFAGPAVALLGPMAMVLLVVAVANGATALVWAFAAVWVLTLLCLLRLLVRWSRRHLRGDERPRPDERDV